MQCRKCYKFFFFLWFLSGAEKRFRRQRHSVVSKAWSLFKQRLGTQKVRQ